MKEFFLTISRTLYDNIRMKMQERILWTKLHRNRDSKNWNKKDEFFGNEYGIFCLSYWPGFPYRATQIGKISSFKSINPINSW